MTQKMASGMAEHVWQSCGFEIAKTLDDEWLSDGTDDAWCEMSREDRKAVHRAMCEPLHSTPDRDIAARFAKRAQELADEYKKEDEGDGDDDD